MSAVRVNEAKVFATTSGADWWAVFSIHQHARLTPVVVSMGGNLVDVACEDEDHATWLAAEMVGRGIPQGAVKVIR